MIGSRNSDCGFTGLELVIIIAVLIGAGAIFLFWMEGGEPPSWERTFPGGLVAECMYMSGDGIQPAGSVTGFPAVYPGQTSTPVIYKQSDPGRMGSVQVLVSLFMGDTGAIDTDRLNVTWSTLHDSEQIRKSRTVPLVCPNWTITGKYNMLPGRSADTDEWLEPGEQFMVLVCPSHSIAPYESFTLMISPEGVVIPLRLTRTVPPGIRPVMNLG